MTVFVWIFLMNAMDMLPVDLLPVLWQGVQGDHHAYLRVVPTADLSTTLGLSFAVLILCFYYSLKIKGGWLGARTGDRAVRHQQERSSP